MSPPRISNNLFMIYYITYCIFGIALATTEISDVVSPNLKFSTDSHDFKFTKPLNLAGGDGFTTELSRLLEVLGFRKELGGSTDSEKSAVRAEPLSECLIESTIQDGKSHPVGVNYRRLCPISALNREVSEVKKYIPRSCREIQENGNNVSGIYEIKLRKSKKPLKVLCDMETQGGGWTVIQKRYDGSVDFYLGWREYKLGFGDLGGEFWIGLENIYKMTAFEANELLVEIVDRDNVTAHAHYKSFGIGSEPEGYALNVLKNVSGDAGDSMTYHLGQKFTTKDFDQDIHKENCAILCDGAWWYRDCHASNLNGFYMNADIATAPYKYKGMNWKTFRSHEYSHAKSRMMVRPVVV